MSTSSMPKLSLLPKQNFPTKSYFKSVDKPSLPTIPSPNTSRPSVLHLQTITDAIVPKRTSITARNLYMFPTDEDGIQKPLFAIDSPLKFQSSFSLKKPQRKLPPNLHIKGSFTSRPSQLDLVATGHSPLKLKEMDKSPSILKERNSIRILKTDSCSYQSPTVASLRRQSFRPTKESPERKFNFSKPQNAGYEYEYSSADREKISDKISSDKVSSDEISSALSGGSKSSRSPLSVGIKPVKFEVKGISIMSPQRKKSGFFQQIAQGRNLKPNLGYAQLRESRKIEELAEEEEKPVKKRISQILTKELEERFGIKMTESESSGGEETDEEESPVTVESKHEVEIKMSGTKMSDSPGCNQDESTHSDEQEKEESDTTESFIKLSVSKAVPKTNEELQKIALEEVRMMKKAKPMIATIGARRILQPVYMKNSGSMCITELWSQKSNKKFYRLMKSDVKHVKVHDEKRQHEYLYRPDKWREEIKVQSKIQRIKHESDLENLKALATEPSRHPLEKKSGSLPLLKWEFPSQMSSYLGTPRAEVAEIAPPSSTRSSGVKNLGILANICRNEMMLKRNDSVKEGVKQVKVQDKVNKNVMKSRLTKNEKQK